MILQQEVKNIVGARVFWLRPHGENFEAASFQYWVAAVYLFFLQNRNVCVQKHLFTNIHKEI